jgi:hypothetical protein
LHLRAGRTPDHGNRLYGNIHKVLQLRIFAR